MQSYEWVPFVDKVTWAERLREFGCVLGLVHPGDATRFPIETVKKFDRQYMLQGEDGVARNVFAGYHPEYDDLLLGIGRTFRKGTIVYECRPGNELLRGREKTDKCLDALARYSGGVSVDELVEAGVGGLPDAFSAQFQVKVGLYAVKFFAYDGPNGGRGMVVPTGDAKVLNLEAYRRRREEKSNSA